MSHHHHQTPNYTDPGWGWQNLQWWWQRLQRWCMSIVGNNHIDFENQGAENYIDNNWLTRSLGDKARDSWELHTSIHGGDSDDKDHHHRHHDGCHQDHSVYYTVYNHQHEDCSLCVSDYYPLAWVWSTFWLPPNSLLVSTIVWWWWSRWFVNHVDDNLNT